VVTQDVKEIRSRDPTMAITGGVIFQESQKWTR
jgi:hypothetical protein